VDPLIGGSPFRDDGAVGARVLMVDADPSLVRSVETYLQGRGFATSSASRGEEGVERARELRPDTILLDGALPDLDPGQFLQRLWDDDLTRHLPVILLAASAEEASRIKRLPESVDDYITKPFAIRELEARIRSLLGRRKRQTALTEAEKRKTLREVIASVSHGVNNPLAAILMSAEALAMRHAGVGDVVEKSRTIQENVLRIRDILKRLEQVRVLASKPYVAGERILDLSPEEDRG
jgi:CheY-like chemotaxis protein